MEKTGSERMGNFKRILSKDRFPILKMSTFEKDYTLVKENTHEMDYQPPRMQDLVAALLIGLMAALAPIAFSALLSQAGAESPGTSATMFISRRWILMAGLRLCLGTCIGAYFIREMRQEARLCDVHAAAYPDSRFISAGGLKVHYLEQSPVDQTSGCETQEIELVLIMLHGFGGSAVAFRAVMQPLAQRLHARILAVDMPGFGLTERPQRTADYDPERVLTNFISAVGLADPPASELGVGPRPEPGRDSGRVRPRLMVVGHSMGSSAAVNYALRPNSAAAAVVLVAPAIAADANDFNLKPESQLMSDSESDFKASPAPATTTNLNATCSEVLGSTSHAETPRPSQTGAMAAHSDPRSVEHSESDKLESKGTARAAGRSSETGPEPSRRSGARSAAGRMARAVRAYAWQAALGAAAPVAAAALRRAVYSPDFWDRGLRSAYYDPARLTPEVIADYRRPSRVRGWDTGMIRFVRFQATRGRGLRELLAHARRAPEAGVLARLRRAGLPVLVIHGEADRLVPPAAGRAVSRALGAAYAELPRCGHCPMEEDPDGFVQAVAAFVEAAAAVRA